MLTDYHTHLRPDEREATAERFLTAANVVRYVEAANERGVAELGFAEHVHRFSQALEVWRHPFWEENAVDDLDAYCAFVEGLKADGFHVKLGLELDWIAGKRDELAALVAGHDWDYIVGSVHFIAADAVDHDEYDVWRGRDADEVWARYFETLGEAAASGLFDILAHPDLVKVWGAQRPLPAGDLERFYELAMPGIESADLAIEVSTAGLRKPVGEIYPARRFLEMCLAVDKPIALSSDAHRPEEIGYGYAEAVEFLRDLGVERLSTFAGRARAEAELG